MIHIGEKFLTAYQSRMDSYSEIFVNPTKKEMLEAAGPDHALRFIALGPGEKLYVGPWTLLHSNMSKAIFDDAYEIEWILEEGAALIGVAEFLGGRFEFTNSDFFELLFDPDITEFPGRVELYQIILEQDWSWVERYISIDRYFSQLEQRLKQVEAEL